MVLIQYTYRNWVVLTAVHPRLGHPFKLKMWSLMTWPTWPSWLFNKRIPSHGFVAFWDLGWPSGFMPLGGLSRRSGMPLCWGQHSCWHRAFESSPFCLHLVDSWQARLSLFCSFLALAHPEMGNVRTTLNQCPGYLGYPYIAESTQLQYYRAS